MGSVKIFLSFDEVGRRALSGSKVGMEEDGRMLSSNLASLLATEETVRDTQGMRLLGAVFYHSWCQVRDTLFCVFTHQIATRHFVYRHLMSLYAMLAIDWMPPPTPA